MTQKTTLYIVRHGESVANRDEICGGNYPLTDLGVEQARETKELLKGIDFDAAYSSDLIRAVQTAEIISGDVVPIENQRQQLRERDFGPYDDKPQQTWLEIKDAYEAKYAELPFPERWDHEYSEGIENDKDLCLRFMSELAVLANEHRGQTVLVAAHAGPIRVILMYLGYVKFLTVGSFKNAGYVQLTYDGNSFSVEHVVGIQEPVT